jgi:hypothetical protein
MILLILFLVLSVRTMTMAATNADPSCSSVWIPPGNPARSKTVQIGGPKFKKMYANAADYWDIRYKKGDSKHGHAADSGAGSRGKLANFKAKVINAFVSRNHVKSVIDFGVGDGTQLALSKYRLFTGVDVSQFAVQRLAQRFAADWRKRFIWYNGTRSSLTGTSGKLLQGDLSMSLEVIFHITQPDIFSNYMELLFDTSKRFVIILSNDPNENEDCNQGVCYTSSSHLRYWAITRWVENNRADEWQLAGDLQHKYPEQAWSDFYFFARVEVCEEEWET